MIRKQTIRGLYGIADAGACNGDPVRGAAQLLTEGVALSNYAVRDGRTMISYAPVMQCEIYAPPSRRHSF